MSRNSNGGLGRWVLHGVPDYAAFNPYETTWRPSRVCDIDAWRWQSGAACTTTDPEIWFEVDTRLDRQVLSALCDACPVQTQCLEHAMHHDEHGWWGGTTRNERRKLQRTWAREERNRRRGQ